MVLGLTADFLELQELTEEEDAVSKISMAVATNLTNKTFLRGISDALNAISDPERYGARWAQSVAGSTVPAIFGALTRTIDPTLRRPSGPLEAIQARIPVISKSIKPLRNVWGEPVIIQETGPERFLSPVRRSLAIPDKSTLELIRLDIHPGTLKRKLGKIELSEDEYDNLVETAGTMAHERVYQIVNNPNYDSRPDEFKERIIKDAIERARAIATMKIKMQRMRR